MSFLHVLTKWMVYRCIGYCTVPMNVISEWIIPNNLPSHHLPSVAGLTRWVPLDRKPWMPKNQTPQLSIPGGQSTQKTFAECRPFELKVCLMVGGCIPTPLKNMTSSIGDDDINPILMKI